MIIKIANMNFTWVDCRRTESCPCWKNISLKPYWSVVHGRIFQSLFARSSYSSASYLYSTYCATTRYMLFIAQRNWYKDIMMRLKIWAFNEYNLIIHRKNGRHNETNKLTLKNTTLRNKNRESCASIFWAVSITDLNCWSFWHINCIIFHLTTVPHTQREDSTSQNARYSEILNITWHDGLGGGEVPKSLFLPTW